MELLQEFAKKIVTDELKEAFGETVNEYEAVYNKYFDNDVLKENVTDLPGGMSTEDAFDEIQKRFEAARKGMSAVNRLAPGEFKSRHAKRVMGNLNRIRAMVKRLEKQLDAEAGEWIKRGDWMS